MKSHFFLILIIYQSLMVQFIGIRMYSEKAESSRRQPLVSAKAGGVTPANVLHSFFS